MRPPLLALMLSVVMAACTAPVAPPAGSAAPTPGGSSTPGPSALPPETPGSSETPVPTDAADGVERLITDLTTAGAEATAGDAFDATPLARAGQTICVDGESVSVYIYASAQERSAVVRTIDPNDPSHIGTAIIEWVGSPKFWQRDRIIVLYAGKDEDVTNVLLEVLGQPFAAGPARPAMLPTTC